MTASHFVENGFTARDVTFTVQHTELNANGSFSAADFDVGIDVDEGGVGSVIGRFVQVKANGNFEQGIDLNENAAGDVRVVMTQVEGSGNAQEGIEFEEDDDVAGGGDIDAQLLNVTTIGNGTSDGDEKGDAGLKLREKGVGNLTARIVGAVSSHNEHAGILVREDAAGNLDAEIVNATTNDNGDGGANDVDADGIKLDEKAPAR